MKPDHTLRFELSRREYEGVKPVLPDGGSGVEEYHREGYRINRSN